MGNAPEKMVGRSGPVHIGIRYVAAVLLQ